MATTTTPSLSLLAILTESKRIINAHSRHFLALSVIFLLPFSFSLIVSPTLLFLLTPSNPSHIHILLRQAQAQSQAQSQTQTQTQTTTSLPFHLSFSLLIFFLFLLIFSLCALATITLSIFHGFFGRPVKLLSTVKSIHSSFFPLLATSIVSHLILLPLPILLYFLGAAISFYSPIFIAASIFLLFALLYLRISWSLAFVIAIIESNWGLEPLRRSTTLMKGMKIVGAFSYFFFTFLEGILLWSGSLHSIASDGSAWRGWGFVLQIVVTSMILMLLLLYNTAANTVLYMYCKAVHGELASEIAEEFRWQYVSLPFDDGKVPHVVSVVHV